MARLCMSMSVRICSTRRATSLRALPSRGAEQGIDGTSSDGDGGGWVSAAARWRRRRSRLFTQRIAHRPRPARDGRGEKKVAQRRRNRPPARCSSSRRRRGAQPAGDLRLGSRNSPVGGCVAPCRSRSPSFAAKCGGQQRHRFPWRLLVQQAQQAPPGAFQVVARGEVGQQGGRAVALDLLHDLENLGLRPAQPQHLVTTARAWAVTRAIRFCSAVSVRRPSLRRAQLQAAESRASARQ